MASYGVELSLNRINGLFKHSLIRTKIHTLLKQKIWLSASLRNGVEVKANIALIVSFFCIVFIASVQRIHNGHAEIEVVLLYLLILPFVLIAFADIIYRYKRK
jgi:hypothetical protein